MTETPWGNSEQLRAHKLAPGLRLPAEEVAHNQRRRLLAAMVASVAEHGYERTTVGDVVEMSGVSRTAFYRHFANKEDCFVAAVDGTIEARDCEDRRRLPQRRQLGHPPGRRVQRVCRRDPRPARGGADLPARRLRRRIRRDRPRQPRRHPVRADDPPELRAVAGPRRPSGAGRPRHRRRGPQGHGHAASPRPGGDAGRASPRGSAPGR